jgi:tetratricopeptide (TPR) repeat protein
VRSAPTAADAVMLGQQELVPTLIARHDAVVRSDPAGDERIRVTHTLLGVLDEIDDAPSIVAILHRVGRWLYEAGSRESGRRAINRALTGAAALSADELAELHAARVDVLLDPKHDGDDWVTTALAAAERAGRGDLSLRVRVAAANHALSRGTPVDVLAETARVLASAKAYGDVGVGLIGHASRVRVRALHQAALHAEAWDLLRGLDPEPDGAPERADTDVALARALAANGHVDEAVAHVARARDAYRRLGWRQREAVALANMGGDLVLAGRRAQAIELLTEALEVLQHIGERYAEIAVRCNLAVQHLFDFDHEAATGTLQVADMLCDRHHLTGTRAIVAHNLATAAWQRGDLAGALAHADRGSALATAAGATRQRGLIEAWRAGILAAMGDRGSADRALADAIQRLPAEDSAAAEVIEAIRHHVDGTDPSLVTARGPRSLMLRALLRRDRSDDGQGVVRRAP